MKYERVDLNKYFGVFRRNIRCDIKTIKNAEDDMMIIQYLKETKSLFSLNNNPSYMKTEEENSEVKKEILAARVRQYIKQEARIYSNMNNI